MNSRYKVGDVILVSAAGDCAEVCPRAAEAGGRCAVGMSGLVEVTGLMKAPGSPEWIPLVTPMGEPLCGLDLSNPIEGGPNDNLIDPQA